MKNIDTFSISSTAARIDDRVDGGMSEVPIIAVSATGGIAATNTGLAEGESKVAETIGAPRTSAGAPVAGVANVVAAGVPANGTPSSTSTNTMDVGTNMAGISYYSATYPFLDRFKTSSEWIAQGLNGQPVGAISLDANGYPTGMPSGAVNLLAMVGLDPAPLAMTDVYVITYKGSISLDVTFATILSSEPGKIVFRLNDGLSSTAINIRSMDPGNPLTEMHIVRQDQVALYESGEIFNPDFIAKASQWSELRYMDWGNTNNNTVTSWDQRATTTSASWAGNTSKGGVPIEIMVALANKTGTDMWINIPAEANDDYVRKTMQYVRDNLNPSLTVKVEYSNEVWNWGFQQAGYSHQMAANLWGTDLNGNGQIEIGTDEAPASGYLQYYGYRSAQIASIANSVFGSSAATRLQNVISTQTGYLGVEEYVFQGVQAAGLGSAGSLFKDYAITTYFSLDSKDQATIVSWAHSGQAGLDAAFAELNSSLTDNIRTYVYQQAVAARNGLSLVAYEGGVSLVPYTFADTDQADVLAFFKALDNDPRMGDMYTKMVADFAASGGSGLNAFTDAVAPTKWGTWGTLDNMYDETSPRYAALVAASQSAKASNVAGTDPTQINVRTGAATYVLRNNQLTLTYVGSGGFNGTGNDLSNTIVGGNSFNMLYGGGGNDTITGGNRNDIIDGGSGADRMTGGAGNDTYTVDNIGDVVVEQADGGLDEVRTTLNSYTLSANLENLAFTGSGAFTGIGNDLNNVITAAGNPASLYGGAGNDTLNGSVGADTLDGGTGADIMRGGMGNDVYLVDNVGDNVIELGGGGVDLVRTTLNNYALGNNLENLVFTGTGNFSASANAADNVITGAGGDDNLWGEAGNDTLYGRLGNDALYGGAGADTMIGGLGDDRYEVDNVGDVVVETAGQGNDVVYSTISYTMAANVESLHLMGTADLGGTGNDLNNWIEGNSGDNILSGGAGNDIMMGGAGNDTLNGGDGNDNLVGGDGNDLLYGRIGDDGINGGNGNDTLIGGLGRDVMDGDAGADIYIYSAATDTGRTHATADVIYFSHSDGDLIDLSKIDARTATSGDEAFSFIGQAAFTNRAGELRLQYSGGYWDVLGDTNGDGVADFCISVNSGSTALVARDFVL